MTTACRVDGSVSVISSDRARVSSRTSGSILSASRLSCEAASRAMQLCRSAGVTVVVVSVVSSVSAASSAVSSAAGVGVGGAHPRRHRGPGWFRAQLCLPGPAEFGNPP